MSRKKFTEEEESILLDESADPVDRSSAIDCMASDGLWLHGALVISLFDHQEEELRSSSVRAATRWDPPAYTPLLVQQLLEDPSSVVRSRAAITLEWVGMTHPALRPKVCRALAKAVDRDPKNDVSYDAYRSLVTVVTEGHQRLAFENDAFDRTRDVDSKLIGPYRTAGSEEHPTS